MSVPTSAASPHDQGLLWVWTAVVTWCSEKKNTRQGHCRCSWYAEGPLPATADASITVTIWEGFQSAFQLRKILGRLKFEALQELLCLPPWAPRVSITTLSTGQGSAQAASVFKHQSSAPGRNLDLKAEYVYQTNILPSLAELYNSEVFKVFLSLDMCSS